LAALTVDSSTGAGYNKRRRKKGGAPDRKFAATASSRADHRNISN
jgi:hypothetical protein